MVVYLSILCILSMSPACLKCLVLHHVLSVILCDITHMFIVIIFQQIRHEFLAVLQALVLAYPEHHDFVGLSGLCDTDVDADFFVNIRHIQVNSFSIMFLKFVRQVAQTCVEMLTTLTNY